MGHAPDPQATRLDRLRARRTRPDADLSLTFLRQQFRQQVEKPYKQLGDLAERWRGLVPADLADHCRLEGLSRGVLRVGVDSSPHLYELDRLLRQGLERRIIEAHRGGALRKVKLRLVPPMDLPEA